MTFSVEHGDSFTDTLSFDTLQQLIDLATLSGIRNVELLSDHATRRDLLALSDTEACTAKPRFYFYGIRLRAERWVTPDTIVAREER